MKKTLLIAADAMRVSVAFRLLHRDNGATLPIVVCWDLEPDLRVLEPGVAGRWAAFEELLPRIDALRARLAKLTLAPASFFPLASDSRGSDGAPRLLTPYAIPSLFALRLLRITRTVSPPVVALAIRTDQGAIGAWDFIGRNLEHLARVPGVRFVTASEAAADLSDVA